jgi:signal transduction histidine kinase
MDQPRPPAPHAEAPPDDPARRLARAERVLACFQRALGHDLPNQLVALRGLLQVLELEEGGRLSAEGRDYLRRLATVTGRLQDLLGTLKTIGRAAADPGPAEEVSLAELACEAAAEVKQVFPARAVTYHMCFQAPAVRTCRRPLQRAVVELVRIFLAEAGDPAGPVHLRLDSRATPDGVELSVGRHPEGAAASPTVPGGEPTAAGRLTLALVRELADTWGGTLTRADEPGRGTVFTIFVRPPG